MSDLIHSFVNRVFARKIKRIESNPSSSKNTATLARLKTKAKEHDSKNFRAKKFK